VHPCHFTVLFDRNVRYVASDASVLAPRPRLLFRIIGNYQSILTATLSIFSCNIQLVTQMTGHMTIQQLKQEQQQHSQQQ
jgi:hypothetical protein